ncbi:MAG TPA: TraB/GumN family protein [Deltaproteobacteria bacterium]|nr:TraB/GumN family protein [Deltaproteobacteria bacterium]HPR53785.1 TraB/GumN family protein [Deltaproteobacteria bacterium]HXK46802.1 TraB/GumN family protein [Deltaproteobacteria bacterium]
MPTETIHLGDREIIMVGTAHVSRTSVEEVRSMIRETRPDAVAVELCQARFDVMKNPGMWQNMDIFKVIKEKKAAFLMANLVMSSFQRRIGEKLGVKPGDEMRAAIDEAEAGGIDVVLVDRNVQVTLARTWRSLTFWEKMKLLYASLIAIFEAEDLNEDDIEKLKEKDMLTTAVEDMAKHAPTIKEVLIDERDAYMARKIADIHADRVVAVIGAGHMKGIVSQLEHPIDDLGRLEEVPAGGSSFWSWVLPLFIVALLVSGFFFGGTKDAYDMIKWWVISTMACTAIATIIAFAHPVTILVATLVAPLTTLHPALASGWFAGLSEAYMKKPRVVDFEHIHDDIMTLKGWWRNPITRILLVFFMSNLGSSIGVFIAAPILTKIALTG